MAQPIQAGPVYVKGVKFTAKIRKVTVHKFQGKCTVQLGEPDKGNAGIEFHGEVNLAVLPNVKGKRQYGVVEIVQNTQYAFKRTPPLHPDPSHRLKNECCNSKGQWELDGAGKSHRGSAGLNVIMYKDSPGVFLEENVLGFENVNMDAQFRTYLCWTVGGAQHVLARIDWSCKGSALGIGAAKGDCGDPAIPENWVLAPRSAAQQASPAVFGAAASQPAPVAAPPADPTKWKLC